ncbi:hypothetical protein HZH66_008573 [Vespula vulgaris]|uniref:Uncharacterized protein n=1 Tax=Vespula vulgaris TaxID=7454 RepID=A0A834JRF3_VESVU|nr:hypothetical protein HZH66_008573 [Vespula vulgaris]
MLRDLANRTHPRASLLLYLYSTKKKDRGRDKIRIKPAVQHEVGPSMVFYKRGGNETTSKQTYEMFRSSFLVSLFLVGLVFSTIVSAIDVSKTKKTDISLTENDVVPKTQLKQLVPSADRSTTFVGDVSAGGRYPNEVVYRRILQFDNPTGGIHSFSMTLSVPNGIINYVNIMNNQGSYAVACIDESTLESSKVIVHYRIPASSTSYLMLIVAAH